MKNSIKLFALAAVAAIVVACGGGNPLVQSWKLSSMTVDGKPWADVMMEGIAASMPNDSTMSDSLKNAMMEAKKAEMTNMWNQMLAQAWTFTEDGNVTMGSTGKGKWTLSEDKKKLTITPEGAPGMEYEVVELTAASMKLKITENGKTNELAMVPSAIADVANAVGNAMSGAADSSAAH